jgi:hypothetical protein
MLQKISLPAEKQLEDNLQDPPPSPFDRFRLRSGLSNCEKEEGGNDRVNL